MSNRQDFLAFCNEFAVPVTEFEGVFCIRCQNAECTRSKAGQGKFEVRVNAWEERLFTLVPRMQEDDPRLKGIRAKSFISLDPGRIPEVGQGAWIDPRDLERGDELTESEPLVEPLAHEAKLVVPIPELVAGSPRVLNTPARSGVMLGSHLAPEPRRDPWAPPSPPAGREGEGGEVVKPGAKVRFRSAEVEKLGST